MTTRDQESGLTGERMMQAIHTMVKLDIAKLEEAAR